jgi:hypothetical protein
VLPALLLAFATAVPAPAGVPAAGPPRVFFTELDAGAATTRDEARLLGEALLVEARHHADVWSVIGTKDLTAILDVEASKQATGCNSDSMACASEIAGALNAPNIVHGTLGHVGELWVLTLSRVETATLAVVASAQAQAEGPHPDVLFPKLRGAVADVLGVEPYVPPTSPLVYAGAATAGVGAVALALAGGGYALAKGELDAGLVAQKERDEKSMLAHRDAGQRFYVGAIVGAVAAPLLIGAGAAVLALGLTADDE